MTTSVWKKAQESEALWWRTEGLGVANSYHEEEKQLVYAERMGIEVDEWCRIDLHGKNVLDIGGGPASLLLKTFNAGRRKVIDPLDMPRWVFERYKDAGIELERIPAEELIESDWDEVWIYNVLQHVQDPLEVIRRAKGAGKLVRVFEFLERPANETHPHVLTVEMLNEAFGHSGTVTEIQHPVRSNGNSMIVGKVFYGVFGNNRFSIVNMDPGIIPEEIELNWVNTGKEFLYPYYLSIMTALKTQKAKKFNLWLVDEPTGKYYEEIKNKVTIRHLDYGIPDFPSLRGKTETFVAAHLADYFRLRIIYDNGGIYCDMDGLSIIDYCDYVLEQLQKKEFAVAIVNTLPHEWHAAWFAARKHSPIVKLQLEETTRILQEPDVEWSASGPNVLNRICSANVNSLSEAEYGMLGGDTELYQLFKDDGKINPNHRYVHIAANSINGYWSMITEDYVNTSEHLLARIVRGVLTRSERCPSHSLTLNEWLSDYRNRYRPLFDILKTKVCTNIMEIGVWNGQNAVLMIKEAAKKVKEEDINYYGFDVFEGLTPELMATEYGSGPAPKKEDVLNFISKHTNATLVLVSGLTKDTLPAATNLPKMDLIFVDGGHSVETIRNDWEYVKKFMKASTIVVFDDYFPEINFIGCKFLVNELPKKYKYEIMPELDTQIAPWGQLKVQFMCVAQKTTKIRAETKPALHILGLAHTETTREYMACAYTQKVWKMCKMMKALGYEVYHYGTEGSNPDSTENVQVLSRATQFECYKGYDWRKESFKHDPTDLAYRTFDENAIREINKRKRPRDLLLISMGNYQKPIFDKVGMMGVEMGIGYTGVFTDKRIFESYAWMHYVYGLLYPNQGGCDGSNYDAVIPNYYDPNDFEFCDKKEDYYLYMGRLIGRKGVHIAAQLCERIGARLIIAGQGTEETVRACGVDPRKVEFVGYVDAGQRSKLMSRAKAILVPTIYLEPFGGVNVEAMFCGTPAITSDWGGFVETVQHGKTGYRCRTMDDYVWAAQHVQDLDPKYIHDYAINNYSIQRVSLMYDEYFMKLMDLYKAGWYELHPERTQLDWLKRWT